MTKWAYTDRTLPKKRLTDAEMAEINRLYRIIGADVDKLAPTPEGAVIEGLPAIHAASRPGGDWMAYAPYAGGAFALLLAVLLLMRRRA